MELYTFIAGHGGIDVVHTVKLGTSIEELLIFPTRLVMAVGDVYYALFGDR